MKTLSGYRTALGAFAVLYLFIPYGFTQTEFGSSNFENLDETGIAASSVALPAPVGPAGTIAIATGQSFLRTGKIVFTRPNIGDTVRVNAFGQYRDITPIPATAEYTDQPINFLKPNLRVKQGDIIQTYVDGFVKLLLDNDAVIDIGPSSVVQITRYQVNATQYDVHLHALQGSFRVIVAPFLKQGQKFFFSTPNTDTRVRGTEFIVGVTPSSSHAYSNETFTEILCVHGEVITDVPRQTTEGLVYLQQYVLRPATLFYAQGANGFGHRADFRYIAQDELRGQVRKLSPLVNVLASSAGVHPHPAYLPGTGIALKKKTQGRQVAAQKFSPAADFEPAPTSVWWFPQSKADPKTQRDPHPLSTAAQAGSLQPFSQLPIRFKRTN